MKISRKLRVFFWFFQDLFRRYRRSIFIGFLTGLLVTIIIGRLTPVLIGPLTKKVERIAYIGEFTPSDLPLSIQRELSMGLTTLASDGSPMPGIATLWTIEDGGKQFIFYLGERTWHDGKGVKAGDINYNIAGVTLNPLDDMTVQAILPEPYSPFPFLVSKPILQVGLKGVGTYKVERIKLRQGKIEELRISPVKNVSLPIKQYHVYKTENLAFLAYKRGTVDRIEDVSSPAIFLDWPQTTIRATVRYDRVVGLFFNMKNSVVQNRNVRQALAYATPEFQGEEPAFSPIQKTSWAYNDKVKHYLYDEAQAKKIFQSINLPENVKQFTITTFPQYVPEANIIAQSWNDLGIPTKVKVINALEEEFQILLTAQDLPPDPDQYPFWHSKSRNNITGYTNLKVDKLLEDGRVETDQEKRKKIYADFQKTLAEDLPAIFLYHPKTYTIIRKSLLSR